MYTREIDIEEEIILNNDDGIKKIENNMKCQTL